MGSGFVGADVEQLLALAKRMELQSRKFSEISFSSTLALMVADWTGNDIDRIRSEWHRASRPAMQRMTAELSDLAVELRKQVEQQRSTSMEGGHRPLSPAEQKLYDAALRDPSTLSSLSRDQVAEFWEALSPDQRKALMEKDSILIGNLSGVPFEDRIESNRLTAQERLKQPGLSKEERDYLQLVVDPPAGKERVQLVVYDPNNDRIVEMIGHFTDDTTTVVTYVPGTDAKMDSFYEPNGPQQISRYLTDRDPNTVAFVYKDGHFPQGLSEARDRSHAESNSAQLASFQNDVNAERPDGTKSVAIGHSWGLADITYSEQKGAHYDEVISLSGAYMPEDWKPSSGTHYSNFVYGLDFVSGSQVAGFVGPNFPNVNPEFQKDNHIYMSPADYIAIAGASNPFTALAADAYIAVNSLKNHALVASTDAGNQQVLVDLANEIYT
jgi:hypothetical protein